MKKSRSLVKELNLTQECEEENTSLDIDFEKIKSMVNDGISSAYPERKITVMKSKKKYMLAAAAAALILGIGAYAASGVVTSRIASSSSNPEYTSLPSSQRCIKDIGYSPALISNFKNGYAFKEGSVRNNSLRDESNSSVEDFKSVSFIYEKDGDTVNFSAERYSHDTESEGEIIAECSGTDIYYYGYTGKFVPPDYEKTEEDKRAEANGDIIFSYGTDEIKIYEIQSVSWTEDGIHYSLMQMNGKLSADELVSMAKEVIEQ